METNITFDYLKALSNLIPNGLLTVNRDGRVIVINRIFTKILDKSEEEVVGQDIRQIVPKCQLCKVMDTGTPINSVYKIKGRIYSAQYFPMMSEEEVVGGVAVFDDITKAKLIEHDLYETTSYKKMLEAIMQNTNEGMIIVDKDAKIIMLNASYAKFIGINPDEAKGRNISDIIENTRLPEVIKSGMAEFSTLQRFGNNSAVVSRIPIKLNDEVVAGVESVLFRDLEDMEILYQHLSSLKTELNYYKKELRDNRLGRFTLDNIIGDSPVICNLKNLIIRASKHSSTVLLLGESGTGKELVAHAIHNLSDRRKKNLIKINCAAIPDSILESELFGYASGAFTGAQKEGKPGKFEIADKGTLFLDEIGDMPYHMQAKLLRFLQEKEVERLGENRIRKVDVHVIAATNQDLNTKIKDGKFREDLYYRLNVMTIEIPPLRDHKEDIPLLVEHFIEKMNILTGRYIKGVSNEVMEVFIESNWPGNIRQLENIVEAAYNMSDGNSIELDNLPINFLKMYNQRKEVTDLKDDTNKNSFYIENDNTSSIKRITENYTYDRIDNNTQIPLIEVRDALEKKAILNVLQAVNGNKSDAAKKLGITRASLYKKLKKYNI